MKQPKVFIIKRGTTLAEYLKRYDLNLSELQKNAKRLNRELKKK